MGQKLQNKEQKEDLRLTIGEQFKYKKMDYIAGWFYKGIDFINTSNSKLAFVTTNSIFQGEQVAFIWQPVLYKMEIEFAYTSFKWGNSAANNAGVTVAIVGLANKNNASYQKYIFDETLVRQTVTHINPYLASGEDILVESSNSPINRLPKMVFGSMPRDGGHLIISDLNERNKIVEGNPDLEPFIKRYIGSEEYIKDKPRYVFWLNKEEYQTVQNNSLLGLRIKGVAQARMSSPAKSTQDAAKTPYAFVQKGEWDEAYSTFKQSGADEFVQLLVPRVSSESRDYVPMGFVGEDTIISDSAMAVYNAPVYLLGLLMSRLHMTWLRAIGDSLSILCWSGLQHLPCTRVIH